MFAKKPNGKHGYLPSMKPKDCPKLEQQDKLNITINVVIFHFEINLRKRSRYINLLLKLKKWEISVLMSIKDRVKVTFSILELKGSPLRKFTRRSKHIAMCHLEWGYHSKKINGPRLVSFELQPKKYKRTIFVYVKSGEGVTTRRVSFLDKLDNLLINTNIFYYEEESGCVFSVFTDGKILFPTNDAVCIECNVRSNQFNPMNLHNCTRSPNPSRLMSGENIDTEEGNEAEKVAETGEEGAGDTATATPTLKDPPENLVMAATLDLGKEEEGKEEENMVDVVAEETKTDEEAACTLISLHSAASPDVCTGSAFPEALYKRFVQDETSLTVEEKKLLVSGLRD